MYVCPLPFEPPHSTSHLTPLGHHRALAELLVLYSSFPLAVCFTRGSVYVSFPGDASGQEPTCQCRRHKRHSFDLCVRKIPWRRAWPPIPGFLPGESNGQCAGRAAAHRVAKSWTRLMQLSTQHIQCLCVNATLSIYPTLAFSYCVHKSVLCVCISIPARQIGSSLLFF